MTDLTLDQAIATGMLCAYHATRQPDVPAVDTAHGNRTFAELNANANRLVRLLRERGLSAGDSVAIVSKNRPEFIETLMAAARSGIRFTPINFHLKGDEIGYIVDNCEAKAYIADASLGGPAVDALALAPRLAVKLACGGKLTGFEDYAETIAAQDPSDIDDPVLGGRMLYTSGTTGKP
ncbi:MAG: AMP-binding protein, partial [Pseudomonadales bacterium]